MSEFTPTMEVRARLTADPSDFVQGMQQAQNAAQSFISQTSRTQSVIHGLGIAFAAGAGAAIAFAEKSFMAAARVQELDVALQAVGKSTGLGYQALADTAKAVKDMGIEMNVAQRSTLMFAQNNLKLADASKLARVAQDLAVLSGKNSTDEFQLLTYAVMTQRSELFKSAGVNGSVQGAYQKMATSLHETTKQLTAAQKVQAAMNMALEEGAKVAGTYEAAMQTPSKVLRSFPRLFDDIQVAIGNSLLKGFGPLIFNLYGMTKHFVAAVEGTGAFHDILVAFGNVVEYLVTPISTFIKGLGDMITKMDTARVNVHNLTERMKVLLPVVAGFGTAFAVMGAKSSEFLTHLPLIGRMISGLSGPLVTFIVLAATSKPVRDAFLNILQALKPLLGILKEVAMVSSVLGAVFVSVLAKALQVVADLINGLTNFLTDHKVIIEVVAGVLAVLGASYLATQAYEIAFTYYTALATMAMDLQAAAGGKLAIVMNFLTSKVTIVIAIIVALVTAFIIAWKHSETFRDVVRTVFNAVAHVVGAVVGFVLDRLSDFLMGLSHLLSAHEAIGQVVATVFNFIYKVVLTVVQLVIARVKIWLDVIEWIFKAHSNMSKIIGAVFNFVGKVIGTAVAAIVVILADIIKAIATLIHWFGIAQDFIGEVWSKITEAIGVAAKFIGSIISKIVDWITGHLITPIREAISGFLGFIANIAGALGHVIPIMSDVSNALKGLSNWVDPTKKIIATAQAMDTLADSASATKQISALKAISNAVVNVSSSWGNYSSGVEGTLSKVANAMISVVPKIVDFTSKFDITKVLDTVGEGAKKSSDALGDIISKLQEMKEIDVGSAMTSGISKAMAFAATAVASLSATVKDFTSGDVLGKTTGAIGDLIESMKNSLGFGTPAMYVPLSDEEKLRQATPPPPPVPIGDATGAAAKIKAQADLMKTIAESMRSGIDSIQETIDAMAKAATDFAKSLKDTIVNFAGIKGVQLPDGFVPQAKSLIENMQMRLNKATQFAAQLAQLQAYGIDNTVLKEIIEEGPIKGAALAASILAGGQEVVNQVSAIQKQIQYSGAVIGGIGANAVYGQSIANANVALGNITDSSLRISGASDSGVGNRLIIQQGAVAIRVDARDVTDPKEVARLVTKEITEQFALLAKQLSVKA